MENYQAVAIYAALAILINMALMWRVGQVRIGKNILLGHGNDDLLQRRMRAHANFAETTPLILIGMIILTSLAAASWAIHALGIALVIGRIFHSIGMDRDPLGKGLANKGRMIGTILFMLSSLFIIGYILCLIFIK